MDQLHISHSLSSPSCRSLFLMPDLISSSQQADSHQQRFFTSSLLIPVSDVESGCMRVARFEVRKGESRVSFVLPAV